MWRSWRRGGGLAAAAMIASCAPRAAPPAALPPPPALRPSPPPAAAPQAAPVAWQEGPLAPGDWGYDVESGVAQATFASPGAPLFALRCDPGGQIRIFRPGVPGGPITIVTSFGERRLPGSGNADQAQATLPAADPLFDQMAFSRGRFLVRTAGGSDLVLPAWPEPARLIERCRGQ